MKRLMSFAVGLLAICAGSGAFAEGAGPRAVPALHVAHASTAEVLGVAFAGRRIVSVGDHGVVLLSDDAGKTWRQARSVPVDSALASVAFVDDKRGWAVGHAGVVLASADGAYVFVACHDEARLKRIDVRTDEVESWAVRPWPGRLAGRLTGGNPRVFVSSEGRWPTATKRTDGVQHLGPAAPRDHMCRPQ